MRKLSSFLAAVWMIVFSGISTPGKAQTSEHTLHELNYLLINTVMDDVFTPMVACRIHTYPNIAYYEVIRNQDPSYTSLGGNLNGFAPLPVPAKYSVIDIPVAAAVAFSRTAETLVGSEYKFSGWRKNYLDSLRKIADTAMISASVSYGYKIADAVIAWYRKDNYAQTRAMTRFVHSSKPQHWQPTPVDFAQGLEPHWRKIRPMTLKNASQFSPKKKLRYDMSKQSVFYKNLMEVYKIGNKKDSLQQAIAYYWDDNPSITVEQGHFNYFIHKISPAGHWIMIVRQVCTDKNIPAIKAAQAYALTAISMFDGFIACWDEKYTFNLVRPVTVIKRQIDEKWDPLIQTPPFPEFTSGHAVISNAAAVVLTHLFGDNYKFTDRTEVPFGIPPRTFSSFLKASEESAWSRVYGGIHYPETARISIQQGVDIGRYVIKQCLPSATIINK